MTFADAAEQVLRDAQRAMKPAEIWAEIERRGLMDSAGATPVATLAVSMLRRAANSSVSRTTAGEPRFYRRGDGAFGLWAALSPEQRRELTRVNVRPDPGFTVREFRDDRAGMRERPEVSQSVLDALVPDEAPRRAVARVLGRLIEAAQAEGAGIWKLTLKPRALALTIGRYWIAAVGRKGFEFLADLTALSADDRALIEGLSVLGSQFKTLPGPTWHTVAVDTLADVGDAIVRGASAVIARAAASSGGRVFGARFHSPGAVIALEQVTGTPLPRPSYPDVADDEGEEDEAEADSDRDEAAERDAEASLAELIESYVERHVPTPAAQAFLRGIQDERASARANLQALDDMERRGEDVTDAVLLALVPYTDSERNRARGAWVSHAPAVPGDIRLRMEGGKLVTAGDWPAIARLLLRFVRNCLAAPEQLARHIAELQADPLSKGFEGGMLTPILNALAPQDFPLVNTKVTRVLSYFTGVTFRTKLRDYPRLIPAWRAMVDGQPALRDPRLGDTLPGDAFDYFCHWLVAIRRFSFADGDARQVEYWKISPGAGVERWDQWRREGLAAVGWGALGDLGDVEDGDELRARMEAARAAGHDYKLAGARQAWQLSRMPVGTLLVANRGRGEVVGLGRVTGAYRYVESDELPHQVPVEWFDVRVREVDQPGWARTLLELDRATYEEIAALPGVEPVVPGPGPDGVAEGPPPPLPPPPPPAYTRDDFVAETGLSPEQAERWLRILQDKKQVIIQGPPGTGKTWVAERLAKLLTRGGTDRIELVQFHPAYAYEDFIQGIRPRTTAAGAVTYERERGLFARFCDRAADAAPALSVLIIDEINRANLPRVFGELMYLLEYRDREVELAGAGRLAIPGNVHIIGTMNTADRSIARLDHALRRRFSFLRLQPDHAVLRAKCELDADVVEALCGVLERLNERIADPDFAVGISYFLRQNIENVLDDVWRSEIEPYLEEYFYDQRHELTQFRWDTLATGALAGWSRQG